MDRDFAAQRREAQTAAPEGDYVTRDLDLLAAQQRADEFYGLADRARRLLWPDAEFGKARDAGTNAQHRASVRDLVDRCDRHRGERRMPGKEIGGARPSRTRVVFAANSTRQV